jgi:hypothetical protein
MSRPSAYTKRQLTTLDELRRYRMSWIIFWVFVIPFVLGVLVLLYLLFTRPEKVTVGNISLTLIELVLGLGLKQIVSNLYPKRS